MVNQLNNESEFQINEFKEVIGKTGSEYEQSIRLYHHKTLWTYMVNCILGLWLIAGPFLFDYKCPALVSSDIVSGALIILVELLAFSPRWALLRWCTPFIAFWLLFAPFVFWSPTPAVYLV